MYVNGSYVVQIYHGIYLIGIRKTKYHGFMVVLIHCLGKPNTDEVLI